MLSIVSPGQGSQRQGMFVEWLKNSTVEKQIINYSKITDLDLIKLGTISSDEEIRNTSIAQILLTLNSIISFQELIKQKQIDLNSVIFAGHSVGELASGYFAGFYDEETTILLALARGKFMYECSKKSETGMSAILGGDKEEVTTQVSNFDLEIANVNCHGQIVVAGLIENLEQLEKNPIQNTRVRRLQVSGAFHTKYMKEAQDKFKEFTSGVTFQNAKFRFISNSNGEEIRSGNEFRDKLVNQITSPVRWDLCQDKLTSLGVSTLIELAPAGVLAGLIKRQNPAIKSILINSLDDIKNLSI